MTNEEKYKIAGDRAKAHDKFCRSYNGDCDKCPARDLVISCHYIWLTLEASPVIEPCPFCGGKVSYRERYGRVYCQCEDALCMYMSGEAESEAEAIAAHNRVARAVRAAKESEARHA